MALKGEISRWIILCALSFLISMLYFIPDCLCCLREREREREKDGDSDSDDYYCCYDDNDIYWDQIKANLVEYGIINCMHLLTYSYCLFISRFNYMFMTNINFIVLFVSYSLNYFISTK